jgi:DNA replication protein DnaC
MMAEAWDHTAAVTYDTATWAELTTLRFVDENHNALILGPVGVGKTFLATAPLDASSLVGPRWSHVRGG